MSTAQHSSIPKEKIVELYRHALVNNVPLEAVEEKIHSTLVRVGTTVQIEEQEDRLREKQLRGQLPLHTRVVAHVVPVLCIAMGIFLVGNATWPMISYFAFGSSDVQTFSLLSPIPREQVLGAMPQVITQVQATTGEVAGVADESPNIQPTIVDTELDYINLSNWFPTTQLPTTEESQTEYTLEIPSLNIEAAKVRIGGTNLDKSLIQYPGTAEPGQLGAPVIFGHSVLRQFYNPSVKNPRRYFSIFSKIMTLKTGDKIYLTEDGVKYTYIVRDKHVVDPEDTFILEQRYDVKSVKLVTCFPEGTYFKRGVVTAELQKSE